MIGTLSYSAWVACLLCRYGRGVSSIISSACIRIAEVEPEGSVFAEHPAQLAEDGYHVLNEEFGGGLEPEASAPCVAVDAEAGLCFAAVSAGGFVAAE